MSIRAARVLILLAAGLVCLDAASPAARPRQKFGDTASVDNPARRQRDPRRPRTGDTTGSIVTQPAEPGPSGEPVAPLSKPGLLGDDPNDDVQLGKKYFRGNNFGLAEKKLPQRRREASERRRSLGRARGLLRPAAPLRSRRPRLRRRSLRLIGPTVEVLNDEGFSYMLRGDYARAHKLLRQAQAKDPGQSLRPGQSAIARRQLPRPQGGAVGSGAASISLPLSFVMPVPGLDAGIDAISQSSWTGRIARVRWVPRSKSPAAWAKSFTRGAHAVAPSRRFRPPYDCSLRGGTRRHPAPL